VSIYGNHEYRGEDAFIKAQFEIALLKAEVERLTRRCSALREAGDDLWYCIRHRDFDPDATEIWQEVRNDLPK